MARHYYRPAFSELIRVFFAIIVMGFITKLYGSPDTRAPFETLPPVGSDAFRLLSPTYIVLIALFITAYLYRWYKNTQLANSGILEIDKMSGEEFELRLMILFRNLGYKTKHIGRSSDAGVDLIVEKDGIKTAVQAKRYSENVGEAAVQQVHTGKDFYHCDEAIIVTNSNFTKMAWRVAEATNIKLWNRNYLIKVLLTERGKLSSESKFDVAKVTNNQIHKQYPQTETHLIPYITDQIKIGKEWAEVKSILMRDGWTEEKLNEAFYKAYNTPIL